MTTQERLEVLAIPKWSGDFIVSAALYTITVLATAVAVLNLWYFRAAIAVSCIWLAFMVWQVRAACKEQGGFRKCLIHVLGFFARKHSVESVRQETGSVEIRFGFQLFGRRLAYLNLPLQKIETVEWNPGQNPRLWHVFIWFDHDDIEKSRMRSKWSRKPDQEIYGVGTSGPKKKAEALGLALVDFLIRAGAMLVQGKAENTFVRATPGAK